MKRKLVFVILAIIALLLTLPLLSTAQRQVVIDSTWIDNAGGVFFENHITVYSNGEQDGGYRRRIGDTTALNNISAAKMEGTAESFATDIRIVSEFPAKIKELIRQGAAITAITGTSPIRLIQNKYQQVFIDTAWQVRSDGGAKRNIVFSVTAQGVFRYKIDTLQTRNAVLVGQVLRLRNYLNTGHDIDLYKIQDYRYASADRRVILRLASDPNAAFRAILLGPQEPVIKQKKRVKNLKIKL